MTLEECGQIQWMSATHIRTTGVRYTVVSPVRYGQEGVLYHASSVLLFFPTNCSAINGSIYSMSVSRASQEGRCRTYGCFSSPVNSSFRNVSTLLLLHETSCHKSRSTTPSTTLVTPTHSPPSVSTGLRRRDACCSVHYPLSLWRERACACVSVFWSKLPSVFPLKLPSLPLKRAPAAWWTGPGRLRGSRRWRRRLSSTRGCWAC